MHLVLPNNQQFATIIADFKRVIGPKFTKYSLKASPESEMLSLSVNAVDSIHMEIKW